MATMYKRSLLVGLAAVVVIVVGAVTFTRSSKSDTVTIGALYPLTGGLASYGEPAQKTAQLVVDEVNAAGGIDGAKLVLAFEDHKCDPKEAVAVFNKLHDIQGIRVFTAAACTGTVVSVAPLLKDSVMLAPVISAPKATGLSPNFFRNYAKDSDEAKLFAAEIVKRGYKTVGVIHEETDYAKGLRVSLEGFLKGTGVTVISESFTSEATDVRTQVSKMKALNPDLVFVSPQTVPNAEKVLKAMRDQQFVPKALFVNDNVIKSADLLTRYSDLLNGAIGGDYIIHNSAALDAMLAKYKAKYGMDCPQKNICATVYDSVHMLVNAIDAEGNDAADVQKYLKAVKYDGVSGTVSFDEKNDRANAEYSLFVVKNGKSELYK